ncbi:MAG: hypothetical protein ACI4PR_03955 [Acutalibacteraceae bacterium]
MVKMNNKENYMAIATPYEDPNIKISIAYKGEKNLQNNLFLINEIPYNNKNLRTFKTLFNIFSNKNRPKEFLNFFIHDKKFYSVFNYTEAPTIKEKFNKNLNTTAFKDRCKILENILIKIDKIIHFSPEIVACVTEPENIKITDKKEILFIYNLKNIELYEKNAKEKINENMHDIIFATLKQECEAGFNKQLHIVLYKCKKGLYSSIPEMIIDLKKAEKVSMTSSWGSYLRYQLSLRAPLIKKISQTSLTCAIVIGLVYLGYTKIKEGQTIGSASAIVSIGNINYNGNAEDESDKSVSTDNEDSQSTSKSIGNVTLSEGLDIAYEDYIVQYGDTIESICEEYYKDASFVKAASSFNGMTEKDSLTPGSIFKLPNRTAIALYSTK